jgi:Tfp pilus assembly protein PilX
MRLGIRTRRPCHRGAVVVAIILVLVIVDLVIVGLVLSEARGHDVTVWRLDTVRAFYAAEAGMNMAMREFCLGENLDGDCSIGTISNDGDADNDPTAGTASFMATVAGSGMQRTVRGYGRSGDARREVAAAIDLSPPDIEAGTPTCASTASGAFNTLVFDHAVGSGSNRILVVCATTYVFNAALDVTSVTYDGVPMTPAVEQVAAGGIWYVNSEIWYMLDSDLPPSGTYSVVITASNNNDIHGAAVTLAGAAQQGPEATAKSANVGSTSITTVSDRAVAIDCMGAAPNRTHTPFAGQTEWCQTSIGGSSHSTSRRLIETAGLDTLGWTFDSLPNIYPHVVAAFAPAE